MLVRMPQNVPGLYTSTDEEYKTPTRQDVEFLAGRSTLKWQDACWLEYFKTVLDLLYHS